MRRLISRGRTALVLCAVTAAGPAVAQSMLETSFTDARATLARAMTAHGGIERTQALRVARVELFGQIALGTQGRSADAVAHVKPEGEFETQVTIDFEKGRWRTSGEQRGNDGFTFPFTAIYKEGAAHFLNEYPRQVNRVPIADADEGREQTAGIGTRMAVPLVLKLASTRLAGLRAEGSGNVDGRRTQRISFSADKNIRVTLSIDAETGRVLMLEQLAPDTLLGVDTTRWTYRGTQTVDGLVVPQSAGVTRRGNTVLDIKLKSVRFDDRAQVSDGDFAIDAAYKPFEAPAMNVTEVRPGLWEVANAGQGNYRVQFIELADRLVAYDAPVSAAESGAIIKKLREKVPAKPISHVVVSHFHDDHASGIRAFAEAGATIVTTADAQAVLKRYAEVQMRVAGLVDTPAPALKFALVDGRLELGDATRKVTVIETRGDPHVDRLLALVDGGSKAVMVADAYSDTMPFNRVFDWTAEWVRSNQPATELLLGAHHPPTATNTLFSRQAEFRAGGGKTASR